MINPFIKLTNERAKLITISIVEICSVTEWADEDDDPITAIGLKNGLHEKVIETPEEISAMIQKYYDEKMCLGFILAALNGMCSDSDEFQSWDSVSKSAIHTANMVMENLKNA